MLLHDAIGKRPMCTLVLGEVIDDCLDGTMLMRHEFIPQLAHSQTVVDVEGETAVAPASTFSGWKAWRTEWGC